MEENSKQPKLTSKKPFKLPFCFKKYLHPKYIILTVLGIVLAFFIIRVAVWEHNYLNRMEGSERASSEIQETVVETAVPNIEEYQVSPDKPRYFSAPSIGIANARIVEIGVTSTGALGTPNNIHDIGWYNRSVLPGEKGVSVMDAHGGNLGNGIFRQLPNLRQGEEVHIEMGDGRKFTYQVTEMVTKAMGKEADDYMTTAFTPLDDTSGTLTLITCTGDWWQKSRTFSHRLFVRAQLIND